MSKEYSTSGGKSFNFTILILVGLDTSTKCSGENLAQYFRILLKESTTSNASSRAAAYSVLESAVTLRLSGSRGVIAVRCLHEEAASCVPKYRWRHCWSYTTSWLLPCRTVR